MANQDHHSNSISETELQLVDDSLAHGTSTSCPTTDNVREPTFNQADENQIRKQLNNAKNFLKKRSVSDVMNDHSKETIQMGETIGQLTQLLAAFGLGLDATIRALAYMRGEEKVQPKRALGLARRDRRLKNQHRQAQREEHAAKSQVTRVEEKVTELKDIVNQVDKEIEAAKSASFIENDKRTTTEKAITPAVNDKGNAIHKETVSVAPKQPEVDASNNGERAEISPKGAGSSKRYRRNWYGKGRKSSGKSKKTGESRVTSAASTGTNETLQSQAATENGTKIEATGGEVLQATT